MLFAFLLAAALLFLSPDTAFARIVSLNTLDRNLADGELLARLRAVPDLKIEMQEEGAQVLGWGRLLLSLQRTPNVELFFLKEAESWDRTTRMALLRPDAESSSEFIPQFNAYSFSIDRRGLVDWSYVQTSITYDIGHDPTHLWTVRYDAFAKEAEETGVWCIVEEKLSSRDEQSTRHRIMRYLDGTFYTLEEAPDENEFYSSGKAVYALEQDKDAANDGRPLSACIMYVDFEVLDTREFSLPFGVRAVLKQSNAEVYDPAFICTPDCTIPYTWNGHEYVKGKPVCESMPRPLVTKPEGS